MENDAIEWIEAITGDKIDGFYESLRNGVILCKLLNCIKENTVKFSENPKHPLEERENIKAYLDGCSKLMIPSQDLFVISDLHEGRAMYQVLQNIYAVGRQAQVIEGFYGPKLGVTYTTTLQMQKERKERRRAEMIFEEEQQLKKEEEMLNRRLKKEKIKRSTSMKLFDDEEARAKSRREKRGSSAPVDSHSLRHRKFEVESVKFGLDEESHQNIQAKYDIKLEQDILDWIEIVTKEPIDYFYEGLRSGVVLLKLLNAIKPGIVRKIDTKAIPMVERENIKTYLKIVGAAFNLQSFELFDVSDLYEKKNLPAVLTHLDSLARCAKNSPSFNGPYLHEIQDKTITLESYYRNEFINSVRDRIKNNKQSSSDSLNGESTTQDDESEEKRRAREELRKKILELEEQRRLERIELEKEIEEYEKEKEEYETLKKNKIKRIKVSESSFTNGNDYTPNKNDNKKTKYSDNKSPTIMDPSFWINPKANEQEDNNTQHSIHDRKDDQSLSNEEVDMEQSETTALLPTLVSANNRRCPTCTIL